MDWRPEPKKPDFKEVTISYLEDGKVAIVTLNRPKKINALSFETFMQLKQTIEYLGRV